VDRPWRIELLGGLRAVRGEQIVTRFQTQQTGLLLAYMAYYRQRSHPREALIELLWPGCEPRAGRHRLSMALSALRAQLALDGEPAGTVIMADRGSVRLNPAAVTTDVGEFKIALRSAQRAGSGGERASSLAQAVTRYRGELLPGFFEDWVLQERSWLVELYFQALGQLIAHLQQEGELLRALAYAQRGVRADPLREEAHSQLMRLYAAVGQPAAALRQYQELERLLQEQLEATPAAPTRALLREIERLSVLRPQAATVPRLSLPRPGEAAGVPLSTVAEGENRLVTVLFADMCRSVETTQDLDPEEAAALVNRLLGVMVDAVLEYEGHVDRFLGDGVLAVWGMLQAREDDPGCAIRAALAIREAARKLGLEVTAGINTGEVYRGAVGTERHQEVTVVGPVVNLAARLQEQAEPGQVLVGEATYRQTRRAFAFSSRSLAIKGISQPVMAYAVDRAWPRPEKARGIEGLRAELIGREEELTKLRHVLTELLQGRGQVVSLIGEAGIGKSRLVSELKAVARSAAVTDGRQSLWLEGRCLELGVTTSYSLFVDLFREYFAWQPEEDDHRRVERIGAALQELVHRGDLPPKMGPLIGNLLALRSGSDWDVRLKNASPEQIKHQTFLAVRDLFLALAQRQPLALVLEDLHWADSLSLDLISLLMEIVTRAPVCLLCVYRPEREHKCGRLGSIASQKSLGRYTELHLRELSPPESLRLVTSLLRIERLPAAVREQILERSHGNPFFVEEMIRSFIDQGLLYREGVFWQARGAIETVTARKRAERDPEPRGPPPTGLEAAPAARLGDRAPLSAAFAGTDHRRGKDVGGGIVGVGRAGADLPGADGAGGRVFLQARADATDDLRKHSAASSSRPPRASRGGDGGTRFGGARRALRGAGIPL
jgi:class 3 adenylate cyclase